MVKDLLGSVKEINSKHKSCVYILFVDDILVASTTKTDMDDFLSSEDSPIGVHDDEIEDAALVHGIVLDPLELPFEIPSKLMENKDLYLIQEEPGLVFSMDFYESVQEVTEAIEAALEEGGVEIDDFAVVLGESLDFSLKVAKAGEYLQMSKVYGGA